MHTYRDVDVAVQQIRLGVCNGCQFNSNTASIVYDKNFVQELKFAIYIARTVCLAPLSNIKRFITYKKSYLT